MFDFKFTQWKRYILIALGRSVISKTQRIVVEMNSSVILYTDNSVAQQIMLCFFLKQTKYGEFSKGECEHSSQTPLLVKKVYRIQTIRPNLNLLVRFLCHLLFHFLYNS